MFSSTVCHCVVVVVRHTYCICIAMRCKQEYKSTITARLPYIIIIRTYCVYYAFYVIAMRFVVTIILTGITWYRGYKKHPNGDDRYGSIYYFVG